MKTILAASALIAIGFMVAIGQGCDSGTASRGAGGAGGGAATGGAGGAGGEVIDLTSCDACVKAEACCVVVLGPENCTGEKLQECMSTPEAQRQSIVMECATFTALNADFPACGSSSGAGGSGGGAGAR